MNEKTTSEISRLWTVKETAAKTGLSAWFIYQEIAGGRLPCFRLGHNQRTIRISPGHVALYLDNSASPHKGSEAEVTSA